VVSAPAGVRYVPLVAEGEHRARHPEVCVVPSLLVAGFAAGLLVRGRRSLLWAIVPTTGLTVLFGVVVGIADASVATASVAIVLGMANVLVGGVIGAVIGGAFRIVWWLGARHPAPRGAGLR
jgi:hypothetical protein